MITTATLAFREFLEAFLIIGVFFGISRNLKLKKEFEIGTAAAIGIVISLALAAITYFFGDFARKILNEENADVLGSYLMIFSGIFIAYVVFSLHSLFRKSRGASLIKAHQQLQQSTFDISLFLTIVFLVVREGFEIALFTATTSLFSTFLQNFMGLMIGFISSAVLGGATFFAYVKFPIGKILKMTEYMIVLLGAALVQNGITELLALHFGIHLSQIFSLPLQFLPHKNNIFGHLLSNLLGVDQEFSLSRLAIMIAYIGIIYMFFLNKKLKKLHNTTFP